jgi:deazaflavin-dependent oxidoreductase (nitroreductase family)
MPSGPVFALVEVGSEEGMDMSGKPARPSEPQESMGMRNLTKLIADLLTIRLHPSVIRAGGWLHRALFRLFRGAGFLGADTLILTTEGRVSGREAATPLYYAELGGHKYVAASFGGSDTPPQWYLNLAADPEVTVEVAGDRAPHDARVLAVNEAKAIWPRLVAVYPPFDRYQRRTRRQIPVIELTRRG